MRVLREGAVNPHLEVLGTGIYRPSPLASFPVNTKLVIGFSWTSAIFTVNHKVFPFICSKNVKANAFLLLLNTSNKLSLLHFIYMLYQNCRRVFSI